MKAKVFLLLQFIIATIFAQNPIDVKILGSDMLMNLQKWTAVDSKTGNIIAFDTSQFNNKKAFHLLNNGMICLKDEKFKNFILEAEIYGKGMFHIGFRSTDNMLNREDFFMRLMASNNSESLQYLPIINGAIPWQLYSNYQARAYYKDKDWNHVRLEVVDKSAKIFINNSTVPNLIIMPLKSNLEIGELVFSTGFGDAYLADLKIEKLPDDKIVDISKTDNKKVYISNWLLSNPFFEKELDEHYFKKMKDTIKSWQPVKSESDGLVVITKYFQNPAGTVFLKTNIVCEDSMNRTLLFDYTEDLEIILNNYPIYYGKELMEKENMGRIVEDEQKINLNLKKGNNELVFVITGDYKLYKVFNRPTFNVYQAMNWGFIAKLDNYEKIKIE